MKSPISLFHDEYAYGLFRKYRAVRRTSGWAASDRRLPRAVVRRDRCDLDSSQSHRWSDPGLNDVSNFDSLIEDCQCWRSADRHVSFVVLISKGRIAWSDTIESGVNRSVATVLMIILNTVRRADRTSLEERDFSRCEHGDVPVWHSNERVWHRRRQDRPRSETNRARRHSRDVYHDVHHHDVHGEDEDWEDHHRCFTPLQHLPIGKEQIIEVIFSREHSQRLRYRIEDRRELNILIHE